MQKKSTWNNKQDALGFTPLNSNLKGTANGLAELDTNGKVPSSQLPSYVDDVLEYSSSSLFPTTGETGKIYVDTSTNLTYRWSGTIYVEISPSLALGETQSTAYRGDRGKIAYDHSQTTHAPSNATVNDIDANLKNRANHTGTQLASTISDFATTVRGTVLTGLSTVTNAVITTTDNILTALGKIQKQISDNLITLTTHMSDSISHVTSANKTAWNTVTNKVDKVSGKSLISDTEITRLATIDKYILPKASDIILGGIKIGANLNVTADGTLSANSNPSSFIIKQEKFVATEGQTIF